MYGTASTQKHSDSLAAPVLETNISEKEVGTRVGVNKQQKPEPYKRTSWIWPSLTPVDPSNHINTDI